MLRIAYSTSATTDRDIMASLLEVVWEPFWKILVSVALLGFSAVSVCHKIFFPLLIVGSRLTAMPLDPFGLAVHFSKC